MSFREILFLNSWRIILSYVKLITGYVDFKEFIEQWGGPNDEGYPIL